jgi:hypothetical protein
MHKALGLIFSTTKKKVEEGEAERERLNPY